MGRPREFNEEEVLKAAADAFWERGYQATSTRDLLKRTGLTPSSLYAAFDDKRGLFRKSLDYYVEQILHERITRLEAVRAPADAVTAFFAEVIQRSVGDPLQRGCLLVNSALESSLDDADLQAAIANELMQIERFFHRSLEKARVTGAISMEVVPDTAAPALLSVLLGIRVLARIKPERALIEKAARQTLHLLGLPPLPQDQMTSRKW